MAVQFWAWGIVLAAVLFAGSAADHGHIEGEREAAALLADREVRDLTVAWGARDPSESVDVESFVEDGGWASATAATVLDVADLDSCVAVDPHSGRACVTWCAERSGEEGTAATVWLRYWAAQSADRQILRGVNAFSTAVVELPGHPGGVTVPPGRLC